MINEVTKVKALGIFDGEVYFKRRKLPIGCKAQPCARVAITDTRILEALAKHYGGTVRLAVRKNRPNNKPCFYWQLCNKKCTFFLTEIEPYLISKKERVNKIITG